ncbi:tyrosine-type recombinase/integrase [Niabella hibiscisoli]|uniref:tyrosine-type recombinase/integrase n=1 Tax=Niabella hibiscisoli TaxID=1825928 RepID=UPI001F0F48AE|nr:tyrosine-type recombinase/integrase [Niabella hibiscisoli]MCH5720822.1 tyrosine-type recombinase/integrase [Niabella hibiscisoli]
MAVHDTPRKIDARIDSALKDLNENFKLMAQAIGWQGTSTSYVLRHGFASHLRNNGVDISIIKAAIWHKTKHQTQVYLDDIDDTIVAKAILLIGSIKRIYISKRYLAIQKPCVLNCRNKTFKLHLYI